MSRPTKAEVAHKQELALARAIRDFDRTWSTEVQPAINSLDEQLVASLAEVFGSPTGPLPPESPTTVVVVLENGTQAVLDTGINPLFEPGGSY